MSLGTALRSSLSDFYFNSWRLVPANLAWGLVLVLAIAVGPGSVLGIGLLIALALPTAGLYRLTALLARGEPAMLSDFVDGIRRDGPAALAVGAATLLIVVVLATNVGVGFALDNAAGWFISAMALWGIVGLAMFLVAFWPVLGDPRHERASLRRRLALAGLVVIGRPGRLVALVAVVACLLALSIVLVAAILLVSMAYIGLVSAHVVLPAIDELERRVPEGRLPG